MIFSANYLLSDDQDISQVAGTYVSTNVIDFGAGGTVLGASSAMTPDVGKGTPVPLLVQVTETLTSAGAATLQVLVETSADNSTYVTLVETRAYTLAECVAGLQIPIVALPKDLRRYLRISYVIGTATTTAGKATAGIVAAVQTNG